MKKWFVLKVDADGTSTRLRRFFFFGLVVVTFVFLLWAVLLVYGCSTPMENDHIIPPSVEHHPSGSWKVQRVTWRKVDPGTIFVYLIKPPRAIVGGEIGKECFYIVALYDGFEAGGLTKLGEVCR